MHFPILSDERESKLPTCPYTLRGSPPLGSEAEIELFESAAEKELILQKDAMLTVK
jgi:hypothetical protein